MRNSVKQIWLVGVMLVTALLLLATCSNSDNGSNGNPPDDGNGDPVSQTNRIRIDCPVTIDSPSQDTVVSVDVYLTNDSNIGAFSLGFVHNSSSIEIDTFVAGPALPPGSSMFGKTNEADNTVLVGWADFTNQNPIPPTHDERAFSLLLRIPAGTPPQSISLDSTFVAPAGYWLLAFPSGGDARPALDDCGSADVIIR